MRLLYGNGFMMVHVIKKGKEARKSEISAIRYEAEHPASGALPIK